MLSVSGASLALWEPVGLQWLTSLLHQHNCSITFDFLYNWNIISLLNTQWNIDLSCRVWCTHTLAPASGNVLLFWKYRCSTVYTKHLITSSSCTTAGGIKLRLQQVKNLEAALRLHQCPNTWGSTVVTFTTATAHCPLSQQMKYSTK